MSYFLLKTEPNEYSFLDLVRDGETVWDGVTNNLALKHLRTMKVKDECLIYHTGEEKAVVGIAEVTRDPYPDPNSSDPKIVVVNIKPLRQLKKPVPLTRIKAVRELRNFELVRLPRLSVMPVPAAIWHLIIQLSEKE
ncbi:MAG: EVE domain-containing protein [Candidatus Kryptoniota bacterium]